MISFKISEPSKLAPFLLSATFFLIYLSTTPLTSISHTDSDLMITLGYLKTLAYPPGYPLYIMALNIFTHLPLPTSVAFKAHLLSNLLHTLTLYFTFLSINLLLTHKKIKHHKKLILATLATSSLAISYVFWLQSIIADKYALNSLFATLIIYQTLKLTLTKKPSAKQICLILITFGLSLHHHQTIVLLFPSILYALSKHTLKIKQSFFPIALSTFLSLTIPILIILYLNTQSSPLKYSIEPSISGITKLLTRRDMVGNQQITGEQRPLYLMSLNPQDIFQRITAYIPIYTQHNGLLTILLAAWGLLVTLKQKDKISRLILTIALSTTIFIPLYLDWPEFIAGQAIKERFILLGYIPLPLLVTQSLIKLDTKFKDKSKIFLAAFTLFILYRFFQLYPSLNLRHFDLPSKHYHQTLNSLPKDSLIACTSDVSCFALYYLQYVEHIRSDVYVLSHGHLFKQTNISQNPTLKGFDYLSSPEWFLDYLTWNLDKRPVFLLDLQQSYFQALGMEYNFTYYNTQGYYGQLSLQPQPPKQSDYQLSSRLSQTKFPPIDRLRNQFKANLAQRHMLNAISLSLAQSDPTLINQQLEFALGLNSSLPSIYTQEVQNLKSQLSVNTYLKHYIPGNSNPTITQIQDQADLYLVQQNYQQAFLGYTGILWQQPLNHQVRLKLAKLYMETNYPQSTQKELENILKYQPDFQPAIQLLNSLDK